MLNCHRATGRRPPFFLVHGLFGLFDGAAILAALDPDQPFYTFTARGFDGTVPPHTRLEDMADDYAQQIMQAHPKGPCLIGGLCKGSFVALEVAGRLRAAGYEVGPVLLVDPDSEPNLNAVKLARALRQLEAPAVRRQLHDQAERAVVGLAAVHSAPPFDAADPMQRETAARVGAATSYALSTFVPPVSDCAIVVLTSGERGATWFDPLHPWQRVMRGPRTIHVFAVSHPDMMHSPLRDRLIACYARNAFARRRSGVTGDQPEDQDDGNGDADQPQHRRAHVGTPP